MIVWSETPLADISLISSMEIGGGSSVRRSGVEEQPLKPEMSTSDRRANEGSDFTGEHTQTRQATQIKSFAEPMNFRKGFSSI